MYNLIREIIAMNLRDLFTDISGICSITGIVAYFISDTPKRKHFFQAFIIVSFLCFVGLTINSHNFINKIELTFSKHSLNSDQSDITDPAIISPPDVSQINIPDKPVVSLPNANDKTTTPNPELATPTGNTQNQLSLEVNFEGNKAIFTSGSNQYKYNSQIRTMKAPAIRKGENILVPQESICEVLNAKFTCENRIAFVKGTKAVEVPMNALHIYDDVYDSNKGYYIKINEYTINTGVEPIFETNTWYYPINWICQPFGGTSRIIQS